MESSTLLLLTSSKACLRHPDSTTARENRDTVFLEMRRAIDLIHSTVKDGVLPAITEVSAACLDPNYRTCNRRNHHHRSRYSSARITQEWSFNDDVYCTAFNALNKFEVYLVNIFREEKKK